MSKPQVFFTQKSLTTARDRVQTLGLGGKALGNNRRNADKLLQVPLPVFEKDWWNEASKKHWTEIYPEINHHTGFAVRDHAHWVKDAALVYALTGEENYAELTRLWLLHFTNYEFFAKHPDVGLNFSTWLVPLLQAYEICWDLFTDSQREQIDSLFERGTKAVRDDDDWWLKFNPGGLFNNHFVWHKLMIALYGLFYNKPQMVEYALESNQGIRELIEHGTMDDGLWFESSIAYHYTAVNPMITLATCLKNTGYPFDLFSHRFANGRSLKDLLDGPIQTLFPDATIPTIGDCYGQRPSLKGQPNYITAYSAYGDPDFAWLTYEAGDAFIEALLSEKTPEKSEAPRLCSRIWPEHGYVALRSDDPERYWEGKGFSAFLSFDLNSVHSHFDKLSLMLYGRGSHLAIDPEALATPQHAFSSRVQAELNRATICHNTVMVDGLNHKLVTKLLKLEQFIDSPELKTAVVSDLEGLVYDGVKMRRLVSVTKDWAIDVFLVSSEQARTFDYLYHGVSDTGMFESEGTFKPFSFPETAPWNYLKDAVSAKTDDDFTVKASQSDLNFKLTVKGLPETEVILCRFPSKDDFTTQSFPMLMVRRKGKSAVFVTLAQAERGPIPKAQVSVSKARHGFLRIIVKTGNEDKAFLLKEV